MGKRKERRLAALGATGRRVKLDLWTDDPPPGSEPTGAVASTSLHDEGGGSVDQNHGAGVPSSPSSSGHLRSIQAVWRISRQELPPRFVFLALFGACQENPLSLLGQYSDDDLGEEESKETKDAIVSEPTSSGRANDEVVNFLADLQNHGLLENNSDHKKDNVEDNIDSEHKISYLANSVLNVVDGNAKDEAGINTKESSVTGTKDSNTLTILDLGTVQQQKTEHVENEWKAVIHEESGQYYYWNIRTGETTWEIPSILAQEVKKFSQEKEPLKTDSSQDIQLGLNEGSLEDEPGVPGFQDGLTSTSVLSQALVIPGRDYLEKEQEMQESKTGYHLEDHSKETNGEVQQMCCDEQRVELKDSLSPVQKSGSEDVDTCNSILPEQTADEDFVSEERKSCGMELLEMTEENNEHKQLSGLKQDIQDQSPNPLELLKWSEQLSQRFKAFEGTTDTARAPTLRQRYAVEAEIRLADCRALSSFGGSLEPYWLHVQAQLKRLESVLCVEEAAILAGAEQSRLLNSRHMSATLFSSFQRRIASKTMSNESDIPEKDKILAPARNEYQVPTPKIEQCTSSLVDDRITSPQNDGCTMSSHEEEHKHSPNQQTGEGSSDEVHSCNDTGNDLEEGEIRQLDGSNVTDITHDELTSPQKTEENNLKKDANISLEKVVESSNAACEDVYESSNAACEDVDMEVDMEVEDQTFKETSFDEQVGPSSFEGQALEPVSCAPSMPLTTPVGSTGSESLFPISVGDNLWGAPPPPQPPDDEWAPPPPPDGDSIPPPPPDEPPPPLPSSAPSNGYEEPLCPVLPYTEQYTSAYVPMANYNYYSAASIEAAHPDYYVTEDVQTQGSQLPYYDQTASAYAEGSGLSIPAEGAIYYESGNNMIPESSMYYENVGASTYYSSGVMPDTSQVSTGSITAVAATSLAASSAGDSGSIQAATCVASNSTSSTVVSSSAAVVAAGAKGASKDTRSKKRSIAVAPTLRSNKKVSSLVDKWKAAKEELHGSDDEIENEKPLESLEKKRQREIEEWRMQQIASGEAQDNANFQPLGGDWRERVKRRRTQTNAEKAKSESASVTDNAEKGAIEKRKPNLAEMSKDLPSGWQAFWDESSGEVYFGNLTTSETTWDRPK